MQTWTNSQPTPRLLLWPVRSPVMRWPILLKRPSFLMSMWIISPGVSRSWRRTGSAGSSDFSRFMPRRPRMRKTVALDRPTAAAISPPVRRWRRSAAICSARGGGVRFGEECGRDERSCKPDTPSALKRFTHLRAVLRQTPMAVATAMGVCPSSRTRRTRISRPAGVSGAFLWMPIRSP